MVITLCAIVWVNWHGHNHTDSFFIQIGVYTSQHFHITHLVVGTSHKLAGYTPLRTVFMGNGRILHILADELYHLGLTTGELGHLLYHIEILYRFRFGLRHHLFQVGDVLAVFLSLIHISRGQLHRFPFSADFHKIIFLSDIAVHHIEHESASQASGQ